MALIAKSADGTYVSCCATCGEPLSDPIFATSHFIADKSHDLYEFSDAAMHWNCYARWPHQPRFASMYFDARLSMSEAPPWPQYWPVLWKSPDALVQYGLMVNEVSIILRKSGTDIRIARDNWKPWLMGQWREVCLPGLEFEAVAELLDQLRVLSLP